MSRTRGISDFKLTTCCFVTDASNIGDRWLKIINSKGMTGGMHVQAKREFNKVINKMTKNLQELYSSEIRESLSVGADIC